MTRPTCFAALALFALATSLVQASGIMPAAVPTVSQAAAQPPGDIKVWVLLRDKGPQAPKTGLAYENAPVYAPYLAALQREGFSPDIILKWQNRLSGRIHPKRLSALRRVPGVLGVEGMPRRRKPARVAPQPSPFDLAGRPKRGLTRADSTFGALQETLAGIGALVLRDSLESRGLAPGAGVRIAVLDADFALGHDVFERLRKSGRIRDQYDFVNRRSEAASEGFADSHGASVLSIIGGDGPGLLQGAAPEAEFLLYRTEDVAVEAYVEEDYLAAGIERAVDSGAQVVNISLGYRYEFDSDPDVPFAAMNGKSRPSSVAVAMAAHRNVLVTVSVGNLPGWASQDGTPTLQAPADADSILAVGIAAPEGRPCSYSCWGPTSDGRIKPDLVGLGPDGCAVPVANPMTANGVYSESGTSFSAPALAGVCALLRQGFPKASAMQVREALLRTADRADHPSDTLGYGIARADLAWRYLAGDSMMWANPKDRRYGPKRLGYHFGDRVWPLNWLPGAKPPERVHDMLGRGYPVQATPWGATLEVKPRGTVGQRIYVLP